MKGAALTTVLLGSYAWITAGVAPFRALCYVLVAVPSVTFVSAFVVLGGFSPGNSNVNAYCQHRGASGTTTTVAPWLALLLAALILETLGLLLGGHSTGVPTLSTTVDHLLARQWERSLFCMAWLLAGAVPLRRLWRLSRVRVD